MIKITSEPIGSVPRSQKLLEAIHENETGVLSDSNFNALLIDETKAVLQKYQQTGALIISDGEQCKPSFVTYPLHGLKNLSNDGAIIPFADGHIRQLPKLLKGPFRYANYAVQYLNFAKQLTNTPLKQAVISASAISLIYPAEEIPDYPKKAFLEDLINEAERDIRLCLEAGAENVQIDFTEARLALKLDPTGDVLRAFIELNNQVIDRFTGAEKKRIGVHSCPGGDHDSTHSADIDYADLLPELFKLNATNFYLEFAAETDKIHVLSLIKKYIQPHQKVFIGVTNVIDPRIETPEEIRDIVLLAAEFIPVTQLGTTDDCGFSPFADDRSTAQDIAFAKMKSRIEGTKMAEAIINFPKSIN